MRKTAQNGGSNDPAPDDVGRKDQTDGLEERRRQLEAELASRRPADKPDTADDYSSREFTGDKHIRREVEGPGRTLAEPR